MDLRVRVKISNSLDINNNELVSWALKSEVTKGLGRTKEDVWENSLYLLKRLHIFTSCKWAKNPIKLLVKYNWYKHQDEESNERLKARSRLLLQPAPTQIWAKNVGWKAAEGTRRGEEIAPSCIGDSVFHCSLHLKKWEAAWQREPQQALKQVQNNFCLNTLAVSVDFPALQPWDTASFCSETKLCGTLGGREKKPNIKNHPHKFFPLPCYTLWEVALKGWSGSTFVYQMMKCTFMLFRRSTSRIRYKKHFSLA